MDNLNTVKQRFGIIGNDPKLNHAIERTLRISPTDISVLVSGESGVGKEFIPKIIHAFSARKHNQYIAINCGAIPEGTIDSELFGHEKGAFTGALTTRKGYFEVADGGTIFLDEVGDLPLSTQIRLLRILESGEFLKVGSSALQKTNVRIVAATNINLVEAIQKGKFREDLYYRLNTVEIKLPTLRERKVDIPFIFTKFSNDFAEKYRRPSIKLSEEAMDFIKNYSWPGNIRELKNFSEQLSVEELNKEVDLEKIKTYFSEKSNRVLLLINKKTDENNFANERDILYRVLFDLKKDLNDLKKITLELIKRPGEKLDRIEDVEAIQRLFNEKNQIEVIENTNNDFSPILNSTYNQIANYPTDTNRNKDFLPLNSIELESLSLQEKEIEMIKLALDKNKGKRNKAAQELGISERTLYRKIKQFDL
ncbi:MAG: sigma 54-interacting transcriptional regulator [Solirubrobacteraceae bacterium]